MNILCNVGRKGLWSVISIIVLLTALDNPLAAQLASIDTDIKHIRDNAIPSFRYKYDDYLQYAPAALTIGLKAFGYQGRTGWGRMIVADAFSAALMAGVVNGLKYSIQRMRPDGSKRNSFPSGHTATAFMCATLLYKEYGWRSPWFSIGGYTVATITGISRILNNRHWMSDVAAGAIIGIGAANLGYWLSDLIFKDKYLNEKYTSPNWSYDYLKKYYNVEVFFGRKYILNGHVIGIPDRGGSVGLCVDIPITPRIAGSIRTGMNSMSEVSKKSEPHKSFNIYNVSLGGVYSVPFGKIFEGGGRIMTGYAWHNNHHRANVSIGPYISMILSSHFKIKAFGEYELFTSHKQKPAIHTIGIGYSVAFCW